MRQCFVGVGLMIFLGFAAGTVGFGVGALVFCIGLGKVFVSKTTNRKNYVDDKNDITKL
jgi:small neutral amino acid transporter SnatA (MarC family)